MCNLQVIPPASTFVIPLGCHRGRTLGEVFDENPGWVEWFASQDWLFFSTRQVVNRFLRQGYVEETLKRLFWDEDFRCGGPLEYDVRPAFIPSFQTTRRFNYGQASWQPVVWGPDRQYKQPEEPDFGYQWRSAGPQEPERDWIKYPEIITYRDPYRRPQEEVTCDYTMVEEPADVELVADDPTDDAPEAIERPMSTMAWWDLLADLSCAIDYATDNEDLAHRVGQLDPRIKFLSEALPKERETLAAERRMYRQAKELFKHMSFINGLKEGVAAESKARLPSFLAIVAEVRKAVP